MDNQKLADAQVTTEERIAGYVFDNYREQGLHEEDAGAIGRAAVRIVLNELTVEEFQELKTLVV